MITTNYSRRIRARHGLSGISETLGYRRCLEAIKAADFYICEEISSRHHC